MSALIFLNLLILFLPSQLALHFWPSWSHVFGVRVDYLSPTIFFTDILVWGLIVSSYSAILSLLKRNKKVLFVFLLLSLFNIIFSTLPLLSLVKWLKVFEYLLLVCYTSLYPQRVLKSIYKYLPTSLGITLLLSFAQIYSNHTLGGFFYLLGERSFSVNTPGIALYDFFKQKHHSAICYISPSKCFSWFFISNSNFIFSQKCIHISYLIHPFNFCLFSKRVDWSFRVFFIFNAKKL